MFNVPGLPFGLSGLVKSPTINSQAALAGLPTFGVYLNNAFITFSNNTDAPATATAPIGQTWRLYAGSLAQPWTGVKPNDRNSWPITIRQHIAWQLC